MKNVVLATLHQKARWIAPYLEPLGFDVQESDAFDTDSLGTFSNEVERTLSPKAAALKKAQTACALSAADWGMGSEGSFGGGPAPGLINWNEEVLCLYHASTGNTVYAYAAGPTSVHGLSLKDKTPLEQSLQTFPAQHWILQAGNQLEKGLSAEKLLSRLSDYPDSDQPLSIEPDMRAMYCPPRQEMIAKAAEDLARRLSQKCPQCQTVNFVIKDKLAGLPCALCTLPTELAKAWLYHCDSCDFTYDEAVPEVSADPGRCQFCNP